MPQLMMLNHAAWLDNKRSERRGAQDDSTNNLAEADLRTADPVVYGGKRVSELDTDEMFRYFNN